MRSVVFAVLALGVLGGCSHAVEGTGAPSENKPAITEPASDESDVVSEPEAPAAPPPLEASDIKGVSVSIDGVTQPINEALVQTSNGHTTVTLQPKGGGATLIYVDFERTGTGCTRLDDTHIQTVSYLPAVTGSDTDAQYYAPPKSGCGLNILAADLNRGGKIVGVYDGELELKWGSASNKSKVRAVIKFSATMPTE